MAPDSEPDPGSDTSASATAGLSVWSFVPGLALALRAVQDFTDYDGQDIHAGEVLHFVEGSYFFYDGGHTLFAGLRCRAVCA